MSITLDPKAGVYILPDRLQLFLVLILFPYFPLYLFYLFPDSPIICPEGLHYPKSNLCCRMFSLSVQTFIINNFIFLLRIICLAVVEVGVHSLLHCGSSWYTTIILYVQEVLAIFLRIKKSFPFLCRDSPYTMVNLLVTYSTQIL